MAGVVGHRVEIRSSFSEYPRCIYQHVYASMPELVKHNRGRMSPLDMVHELITAVSLVVGTGRTMC